MDRDESTFIIMAQSWVDGYLPYTQLWDLKPPITFLFFAVIIKVFGKSFIAIRFFGTVLVALTALFTYGIGRWAATKKIAFWSAVLCVFFLSLFGSLQGVMSEHICTLFFAAAVYFLLSKESKRWYFVIGMLFGLSVMSKLNMAYPLLALAIYLLWGAIIKRQFWHNFPRLAVMGIAFIFQILLTALPYYLQGEISVWWQSIFEAPLAYSTSKYHSPLKTLPFLLVSLAFFYITFKKQLINYSSVPVQVLIMVFAGVMLSFVQAGKVNGHYLIQLYPFILILVGIAVSKLPPIQKKYRTILVVILVLLPMEAYLEYANIISNKVEKGSFFNGEGIDVPNYIIKNDIDTQNIFFTEYHIGYWVLGEHPPTIAATHPSNITREELFPYMKNPRKTALEELQYILEVIQPQTVVARKGKKIFDRKLTNLNSYIDSYLANHYILIKTIDRGLIYQRLE